jgi:hypothetical protein
MFCTPGLIFGVMEGIVPRFRVLRAPFGATEGVGSHFHFLRSRTHFWRYRGRWSRFHVLRSQTHIRWYRGRRVLFHVFLSSYSFSAVPRASNPIFMFCATGLILGGTEGVGSRSHVLRYRTHFRRFRWRRIPFSCFASPYSFWRYRSCQVPF